MRRAFRQVDVFGSGPYSGNPVAVVLDADGLSVEQMQRFANWTNLSETTFVGAATDRAADYRVRIFTPDTELPFAGHPTLGTCHAWLSLHPHTAHDTLVQQCAAGLIAIRRTEQGLAFAAPPLVRSGPVDAATLARLASELGLPRASVGAAEWVDNGPGWAALLLEDARAVKAITPRRVTQPVGVVGAYPSGAEAAFEVRAFLPFGGVTVEDPVTGSLNASLAQWLLRSGRATAPYVASQGTALGRAGRVYISTDAQQSVWVAGATVTHISGDVDL